MIVHDVGSGSIFVEKSALMNGWFLGGAGALLAIAGVVVLWRKRLLGRKRRTSG
jgi:nitrate reductase gamma subunit